jgi:hypothetical protein
VRVRKEMTLEELKDAINDWRLKHKVVPDAVIESGDYTEAFCHLFQYNGAYLSSARRDAEVLAWEWTETIVEHPEEDE